MKIKSSYLLVMKLMLCITLRSFAFNGDTIPTKEESLLSYIPTKSSFFSFKKIFISHSALLYLSKDIVLGTIQVLSIPFVFICSLSMDDIYEEHNDSVAHCFSIIGKTFSFLLFISAFYTYKRGVQTFRKTQMKHLQKSSKI
jgi:hypothetical protein